MTTSETWGEWKRRSGGKPKSKISSNPCDPWASSSCASVHCYSTVVASSRLEVAATEAWNRGA